MYGNVNAEVLRAASALLDDVDALADELFAVLEREPGLVPLADVPPDLRAAGTAVARRDLQHELRCLASGAHLPQECPEEVRMTARRTAHLGAPLTFPLQ